MMRSMRQLCEQFFFSVTSQQTLCAHSHKWHILMLPSANMQTAEPTMPFLNQRLTDEQLKKMQSLQEARLSRVRALYKALKEEDPIATPTTDAVLQIIERCDLVGLATCDPRFGECPSEEATRGESWSKMWQPDPKNPANMLKCVPENFKNKRTKLLEDMSPDEEYEYLSKRIQKRIGEMAEHLKWQSTVVKDIRQLRLRGDCEGMLFTDEDGAVKPKGRFRQLRPEYTRNPINTSTGNVYHADDKSGTGTYKVNKYKYVKDPFVSSDDTSVKPTATDVGVCEETHEYKNYKMRTSRERLANIEERIEVVNAKLNTSEYGKYKTAKFSELKMSEKPLAERRKYEEFLELARERDKLNAERDEIKANLVNVNYDLVTEGMVVKSLHKADENCQLQGTLTVGDCDKLPACVVVDDTQGVMASKDIAKNKSRTMAFSTCLSKEGKGVTWEHKGAGHKLVIQPPPDYDGVMSSWVVQQLRHQEFIDRDVAKFKTLFIKGLDQVMKYTHLHIELSEIKVDADKVVAEREMNKARNQFEAIVDYLVDESKAHIVAVDMRAVAANYVDRIAMRSNDATIIKERLRILAPTPEFNLHIQNTQIKRKNDPHVGDILMAEVNSSGSTLVMRHSTANKNKAKDYIHIKERSDGSAGVYHRVLDDGDSLNVTSSSIRDNKDGPRTDNPLSGKVAEMKGKTEERNKIISLFMNQFGYDFQGELGNPMVEVALDYVNTRVPMIATLKKGVNKVTKGETLSWEYVPMWESMFMTGVDEVDLAEKVGVKKDDKKIAVEGWLEWLGSKMSRGASGGGHDYDSSDDSDDELLSILTIDDDE